MTILAVLGIFGIILALRLFGRYLEKGFGRGRHPWLEGSGDQQIGRVFPPKHQKRDRTEQPGLSGPAAARSVAPGQDRPAPLGREETGNPFGE